MKNNVISFSLWGNNPKYTDGVAGNLKAALTIYPEWKVRLYVDETVSLEFLKSIHETYDVDIRKVLDKRGKCYGAYWRFFVNDDSNVDKYIVRDLDSRINWRERAAVDEWLSSDKQFHIMRDHPNHNFPIQAGMWGGTANVFSMNSLLSHWNDYDSYCCDQYFLANAVYPIIRHNSVVHDPFMEKKPFPPHKPLEKGATFVGQVYFDNQPEQ